MTILIATSTIDFDPSEVGIPWKILHDAGLKIQFATDSGRSGVCDQRMLNGNGFGILKPLLIANDDAQQAYREMLRNTAWQNPISYDEINLADYEGLLLPGGHAKGIIPYLESEVLQKHIVKFFNSGKPVGAICHGVIPVCRSINPETGKSILFVRKTTALLKRQEMLAYQLTRIKLGDYYRTYPITVEDEVVATLENPKDFSQGPMPVLRDDEKHLSRGFTVRDGNYLSARWPGDAHQFAHEFMKMVRGR